MVEPTATKKQINAELTTRQVTLSVGQPIAVFETTVYNDSDRFASFQLKLLAAGMTDDPARAAKPWYRLTPSVSSKIPAGDCTRFQIEVFDLPPIAQQFRGAIDLTVEVTSRELENQYDRQTLRLLAEGIQGIPPSLSLIVPVQQAHPGDRVAIVAQVQNPTVAPMEITLRLAGIPERWFPEGVQQLVPLAPGKTQKVTFECEIPPPLQAPSQFYPLRLEAVGRFPGVTAMGQFQVLPAGTLIFGCDPLERGIPELLGRWQNPTQGMATFNLQFDNQSNIAPGVQIKVQDLKPPRRRWFWQKDPVPAPDPVAASTLAALPVGVSLGELPTALPMGISATPLQIQRRLPWLGWARLQRFAVTAELLDSPIPIQNEIQTLQVQVFPVIPLWQQVLGGLLALGLGALTWVLLSDPGHRGPVSSVQFNGQGTEVLSGSADQTMRRWRVEGQNLRTQSRTGDLDKAVRVVRYRPVNNDQVALGFENGEIQLANLLTGKRSRLTPDKDDRVFALVFSRDARTLYSGHGSGLVLRWDGSSLAPEQSTPQRAYETGFAIQSMTLVGKNDNYLAIGGRSNRLLLLDVNATPAPGNASKATTANPASFLDINYPSGGSTDLIASLSAAEEQPNLLAIGDNQGRISLWDMQACLQNRGRCDAIDKPWLGHGGSPVRSVALSTNGCFLASAADDGELKLWMLDGKGMRRSSALEGRVLDRLRTPINAVDVIETRDGVWVTSGGDDGRVRLYKVGFEGDRRTGDFCPVLSGGGAS